MNLDDLSKEELSSLHYATGLLMGLFHKYGEIDVVIYHDSIRIRIEPYNKEAKRNET
jgi:hypothetical protein